MLHYTRNPRHVSSIAVQPFTESDDTRCRDNTICPPEDGPGNA
jgi:hypothetical protein